MSTNTYHPLRTSIIVFIKNPEMGKVKTRLAASVGDEQAMNIYMRLVEHTREVLLGVEDVSRYVYYSSYIDIEDEWSNEIFNKKIQTSGDLGDKIKAAFTEVFQSSDRVIIIGSDCAQLNSSHIDDAIKSLEDNNVAIGPTYDGGYYLLGMDGLYTDLLEDIEWSTDTVKEVTVQKAIKAELTVAEIDLLSDIDYIEDWEKYGLDSIAKK